MSITKGIIVKEKTSLATLLIVAVICIVAVNLTQAVPVTYSFTGVGSGNLDTTGFTNAAFEVLISADTDDMYYYEPDIPIIEGLSATIDISGIGIGTFVNPLYVYIRQSDSTLGFGTFSPYEWIDLHVEDVGLDTYDLTTPFGPITDLDPFFGDSVYFELSPGALTFTSMSYATFTAVPEPATIALLGLGGVVLLRKRGDARLLYRRDDDK